MNGKFYAAAWVEIRVWLVVDDDQLAIVTISVDSKQHYVKAKVKEPLAVDEKSGANISRRWPCTASAIFFCFWFFL